MGRNKNNGGPRGVFNTATTARKPLFANEEKSKLGTNGDEPGNDTVNGGTSPTAFGATADPTTRHGGDDTNHSTSSRERYVSGMYWQTGDVQVLVGGTHEYRLHQEILVRHSEFFTEQLRASTDSDGIIATRSEDIPVVVLRHIAGEAFDDVVRLLYPSRMLTIRGVGRHTSIKQPTYDTSQAERLLRTSSALGMQGVMDFAMEMLANSPSYSTLQLLQLSQQFSFTHWQAQCMKQLVYRTRPISNEEAEALGAVGTAQVARLREFFRARVFARFEPVDSDQNSEALHQSGSESEMIKAWSGVVSSPGLKLGRCQRSILEALKLVFDVDGNKSHLAQYVLKDDASIMDNLEVWLRLGSIGGGANLCKGCAESVGRLVQVYCRVKEMDIRIEEEIGWDGEGTNE
ncbi:The BTB (BR-C, ttk and bab)/POZ (Pox virus and Zinc finger) domain [Ceratobasidium sp. AG-Ba]|nr:The BTB (BR-C, ttk and bab)/POZ (Pox virus and Zinc finger) domain [Ceratobasidium sp. AG-Ba]